MSQVYRAGIPAIDYAAQIGVTPERVYQMVKAGDLEGYKVKEGKRQRLYVVPPEKIIDMPTDPLPEPSTAVEIAPQLAVLSSYNQRLIEPWAERVAELERVAREQAGEIGDLRRQVRQLKRALEGMESALRRVVRGAEDD